MLKVGLTGNIASGKSSVAEVWRAFGATVVDADVLARRAVEPGTPALRRIVDAWGQEVLDASGALDRARLREIVFRDAAARQRLESIVHPAVGALREAEYEAARAAGANIVVADIPLLFEAGLQDEFDVVVLVDAPAELRLRRIVENRGLSEEEARRMIEAQMPAEQKRGQADVVICNDGTQEQLRERAASVWHDLERRAAAEGGA